MSNSKSNKNKLIPILQAIPVAVVNDKLTVAFTREHDGCWNKSERILCFGLWKHQTPPTLKASFEYFQDMLNLPFHPDDITMLSEQHEYMKSDGYIMNERVLVSIRLSEVTFFAVSGAGYPSKLATRNAVELAHPMMII